MLFFVIFNVRPHASASKLCLQETLNQIVKHVPKSVRDEWARLLTGVVSEVCNDPGNSGKWLLLYILPRCILPARPKGQGLNARSMVQEVRAACKKWRQGAIGELWQEAKMLVKAGRKQEEKNRKKKKKKARQRAGRGQVDQGSREEEEQEESQQQKRRNAERASVLVEEGQLSRAAKALISRGIDDCSAEARQEMEEKHPQAEAATPPDEEPSTAALTLTSRQVHKAIWGFKPGTAPGPSGLRGEHLKEARAARTEGRGAATVGILTKFVNMVGQGKVPAAVAPYFFGANLFALLKKNGGFRPVHNVLFVQSYTPVVKNAM